MSNKIHLRKTLGPISSNFILQLRTQAKYSFSLDEACQIYEKGSYETSKFLSDLIKRGILARIKGGRYLILEDGQENTQLSNWPVIARELAEPNDYFISYYSAMRLHGMTTHPSLDVYITLAKRGLRPKKLKHLNYHFVYSKPEHFWGAKILWVTKHEKVFVSDLEKTLLDALERPKLCGGIKDIVRGIWVKHTEINWEKLLDYAEKFKTRASVKRLGFILELLELCEEHRPLLIKITESAKDYILLDPNGPKEGKYLSRWHLQINVDIDELKASVWG